MVSSRTENLVSVIVPVYNAEKYVEKCVESIMNQTYNKLEILLIDDGSKDNSARICDYLATLDQRIKVFHTSNSGAASARNRGLDEAVGEFIMFVDADDSLENNICANLYREIGDSDCCVCGYVSVDTNNRREEYRVDDKITLTGIEALRLRYFHNNPAINIVNPWGKLYHWSMWENKRFKCNLYYEDLEIMPRLYTLCSKVTFVPYLGYYYLIQEQSLSHGNNRDDKRYTDSLLIRQEHAEIYQDLCETKLEAVLKKSLMDLVYTSFLNKWIPEQEKNKAADILNFNRKRLKTIGELSFRESVKYFVAYIQTKLGTRN